MPQRFSLRIEEYELHDLFEVYEVFRKLSVGRYTERLERGTAGPSRRCSLGGESYYTRVFDEEGVELARIHYLRCVFGHSIGVWPSMIRIGGVTLHRQGHQRRPKGEVVGSSVS